MIILFLADGFEEVEALAPVDILRRAGIDVKTVSIKEDKRVRSSHGVVVEADLTTADIAGQSLQAVILPGGMPGASNLDASEEVHSAILSCCDRGGVLAAICAAPMVPGHMGLLQNRQAICYPGFEKELAGAAIKKRAVVCDGNIVTAIGAGAAYEFALKIVELLKGKKVADDIMKAILPV